MILRQVLELLDVLDRPDAGGERVKSLLEAAGPADVTVQRLLGNGGGTDHVTVRISGQSGRTAGGQAPTLGIIGRLGGSGARPAMIGHVSDGDGALAALAAACRLIEMADAGDRLPGDVIVTTHVCPNAPVRPHRPVPMMGSPIESAVMNEHEVLPEMDAVLSIDTTRGNRVLNQRGIAITPTTVQGWILRVADDLLDTLGWVTGRLPLVLPITMQDITPYGNEVYHINSIMQPAVSTSAPVVGVALTAEVPVPGCATGATQPEDAATAAQFAIEVAKRFGAGELKFFDQSEFERLVGLYGPMTQLQQGAAE
ncbi:MAG: DUF1177 domain-containing protein [Trueperaceae bacterium]